MCLAVTARIRRSCSVGYHHDDPVEVDHFIHRFGPDNSIKRSITLLAEEPYLGPNRPERSDHERP